MVLLLGEILDKLGVKFESFVCFNDAPFSMANDFISSCFICLAMSLIVFLRLLMMASLSSLYLLSWESSCYSLSTSSLLRKVLSEP